MEITLSKDKLCEKVVFLALTAMMFSFIVFSENSIGKYLLLGLSLIIYGIYLYRCDFQIHLVFEASQMHTVLFTVCVLLTSVWALDRSAAITKAKTLIEILVCFYGIYLYFSDFGDVRTILDAIKWAGFLIAVYSIMFYGYEAVFSMAASSQHRLDNIFANVNSISMSLAISCVIEFYDFLFTDKNKLLALGCVPCIAVILGAQTKKAFAFIALGVLLIFVLKVYDKKNVLKNIAWALAIIAVIVAGLIVMSKISVFAGMYKRIQGLVNEVLGSGKIDGSSSERSAFIKAGFETWLQHPIGGIGIGSSRFVTIVASGRETYLHNNYIELLCCGGLLCTLAYYSLHVYLFVLLWKNRSNGFEFTCFMLIWLLLIVIMDYGMVTYYSKKQWIYLLTLCLAVKQLKKENGDELDD